VTLRARVTLDAYARSLRPTEYLRAEKKRVLGLFPSWSTSWSGWPRDALREDARQVLLGPVPSPTSPTRDAALVALAAAAELRTLLPGKDRNSTRTASRS